MIRKLLLTCAAVVAISGPALAWETKCKKNVCLSHERFEDASDGERLMLSLGFVADDTTPMLGLTSSMWMPVSEPTLAVVILGVDGKQLGVRRGTRNGRTVVVTLEPMDMDAIGRGLKLEITTPQITYTLPLAGSRAAIAEALSRATALRGFDPWGA